MSFAERVPGYRDRVGAAIARWLPPARTNPPRFHGAIHHAVFAEANRLRPLLVYATGEWLALPAGRLDAIAVAIELVHAYSRTHDELPALGAEDAGLPGATTRAAYDDATAILVGDALQAHAYEVLANDARLEADAGLRRRLVTDLARASGSAGLAGGRASSLTLSQTDLTGERLEAVHGLGAGALLGASMLMPLRLRGDLGGHIAGELADLGRLLGIAGRMARELHGASAQHREPDGQPAALIAFYGIEAARARLTALRKQVLATLDQVRAGVGDTGSLRHACELICADGC